MPRVKDIAWKFVTRLGGEKWRCPHCETEYSGKVTRVKSHFLKHPNKGIYPCKKVPEHISMLMDWLRNQVRNKEDIAWKFVERLEDNKWRCHHCTEEFSGDLTGVKGHLLEVPNEGISICTQVPEHVRTLMRSLLDEVAGEESREVAEEQSREAHGQSSVEPKSRDMPTHSQQAGVAEEEIRGANCQLSTEPESRDMPPPAVLLSPQSLAFVEHLLQTPEGKTLATPSPAQNSHGKSSTMASTEEVPHPLNLQYQPQCSIQSQMQMDDQQAPAGASSFQDDQLPAVDNLDCLQDYNQHSQLQTSMDIDPPIAPQHTSDSHFKLLSFQSPMASQRGELRGELRGKLRAELSFHDFLPTMADKLGGEGLIEELCNGFNLLMDSDKGVITFESLKKNSARLGLQDLSNDDLRSMLWEGDFNGDGVLSQLEFCMLMLRLSPELMEELEFVLEEALGKEF